MAVEVDIAHEPGSTNADFIRTSQKIILNFRWSEPRAPRASRERSLLVGPRRPPPN